MEDLTELAIKVENDLQIDFKTAKELAEYFLKLFKEYEGELQLDLNSDFLTELGNKLKDLKKQVESIEQHMMCY